MAEQDKRLTARELIVGLISGALVAAASLLGQAVIDDCRSDREDQREEARSNREDQREEARSVRDDSRENLRFVRSYSSLEERPRPFVGFDLRKQDLTQLQLAGADFDRADVSQGRFWSTGLEKATFTSSILKGANFWNADLKDAFFFESDLENVMFVGADLTDADFSTDKMEGVNLGEALLDDVNFHSSDLSGVSLKALPPYSSYDSLNQEIVCYDATTNWPDGFVPPEIVNETVCESKRRARDAAAE